MSFGQTFAGSLFTSHLKASFCPVPGVNMTDSAVMSFTMERSCSCLSIIVNPLHTLVSVGASVDVAGATDGRLLGESVRVGIAGFLVGTIATGLTVGKVVGTLVGETVGRFVGELVGDAVVVVLVGVPVDD